MSTTKVVTAAAAGTLLLGLLAGAASASPVGDQPSRPGTITPNIIGGHTPSQPYPGMASLQINLHGDPNWHLCAAVLVSHRYAATNAHCVTNPDGSPRDPGLFHLRVGSPNRLDGGVVTGVTKVLPHADWDWATGTDPVADIALLRLDTYLFQLQPFEIAPHPAGPAAVTRLLGWGVTEPSGEGPLPIDLQELDTRLVPAEQCAAAGITAGEICVTNPNGTDGACYGDSGGPALQRVAAHRWATIGGASRETTPWCGTGPVVYTDMTAYRSWIYEVMRTGTVPPHTPGATVTTPPAANRTLHWTGTP